MQGRLLQGQTGNTPNLNYWGIAVACLVGLIILIVFIVLCVKKWRQRHRQHQRNADVRDAHRQRDIANSSSGLSHSGTLPSPWTVLTAASKTKAMKHWKCQYKKCKKEQKAQWVTRCGHVFHHSCLGKAFQKNYRCPKCKKQLEDTVRVFCKSCFECYSQGKWEAFDRQVRRTLKKCDQC